MVVICWSKLTHSDQTRLKSSLMLHLKSIMECTKEEEECFWLEIILNQMHFVNLTIIQSLVLVSLL